MKLKSLPLEIPEGNPFKNDVLNRKPFSDALTSLVANITPPFVLCIDAKWGQGKTTFLHLWKASLAQNATKVLYFNAWETDFAADPLTAFVSEIAALVEHANPDSKATERIRDVKAIGAKILKRAIPVAARIATAGLVQANDITEDALSGLASDLTGDAIEAYETQKDLIEKFHVALTKLVESLPKDEDSANSPRLLVLIDELDRCRPSYALEMLERIKHVFNVDNVIFALALDKRQLMASIKAQYGVDTDSNEYLRRFIDLEFALPLPPTRQTFTDHLFQQYGFSEAFSERKHHAFQYDVKNLIDTFNALSELFDLSLRGREQCFTRFRVALLTVPTENHIYPEVLVTLTILFMKARGVYERFVSGRGTVTDVMNCLKEQPGGDKYLGSREGAVLEALLISAKFSDFRESTPELEEYKRVVSAEGNDEAKERATLIVGVFQETRRLGHAPSLKYLASIIEIGVLIK